MGEHIFQAARHLRTPRYPFNHAADRSSPGLTTPVDPTINRGPASSALNFLWFFFPTHYDSPQPTRGGKRGLTSAPNTPRRTPPADPEECHVNTSPVTHAS